MTFEGGKEMRLERNPILRHLNLYLSLVGYYCQSGVSAVTNSILCDPGYYCPASTQQQVTIALSQVKNRVTAGNNRVTAGNNRVTAGNNRVITGKTKHSGYM